MSRGGQGAREAEAVKPQVKFIAITAVVVGSLVWLAMAGIGESATYYVTIEELAAIEDATAKRLRVGGDVEPGSIIKAAGRVEFTITQEDRKLQVIYVGQDPLPDTFRDRAQALCDGQLRADNVFEAQKIQAKCASKYEAEPGQAVPPVYESSPSPDQISELR
jgi:cytochrome c-type biogenesis protein CcmE